MVKDLLSKQVAKGTVPNGSKVISDAAPEFGRLGLGMTSGKW